MSDKIAALSQKMSEYFSAVHTRLTQKAESVHHSDNSLKLDGSTLGSIASTAANYITGHAANKANPHQVTPAQVDSYTMPEITDLINMNVTKGVLPISRFGTLNYLPPGASGNFEGATTVKVTGGVPNAREQYSFYLEDDGTLAFLRNGTDGSTVGVYYGYVTNAAITFNGGSMKSSNRRYRPPIVPNGNSVAYLYQGGTGVVAGRLQDNNGVLGQSFLALMNGTLNDIAHVGVFLPPAWNDMLDRAEVILGVDRVYILYNPYATSNTVSEPLEYRLYELPYTAFDNVSVATLTEVTIGECTGFLGATYNNGRLRFADVSESTNDTVPALLHHINAPNTWWSGQRHIGGSGRITTQSAFNVDGSKLRVMTFQNPRYGVPGKGLQPNWISWSFVLDLSTMKATIDAGITPGRLEPAANGTIEYKGPIIGVGNGTAIGNHSQHDMSMRPYITETGLIFTSRLTHSPTASDSIYRGKWNTFTSVFDILEAPMSARIPETRENLSLPLNFGSAAGDSFDGFRLLPGNTGLVMGRSSTSPNSLIKFSLKGPTEDLTPDYTYKSIDFPAGLIGYKPGSDRTIVADTPNRVNLIGVVHEMNDTSSALRGSVLSNHADGVSRYVTMASDLSVSGSVSASMSQLETLRNQIIQGVGYLLSEVVGETYIEVVIPQITAMIPFALVSFVRTNGERRFVIAKVTLSSRTGPISTLTYNSIIGNHLHGVDVGSSGIHVDTGDSFRQSTHFVYEVSDGFMVVGNSRARHIFPGHASYSQYRFFVNKSDNSVVNVGIMRENVGIAAQRWGALPGHGVGSISLCDFATKLKFRKMAKTKAEFAAGTYVADSNSIVLLSQEVAQGWVVYFTEDTSVIVNGVPGVLAPTSIDLNTVTTNPANTTFYVYVEMLGSGPVYRIYDNYLTETTTLMLIGTVKTGPSGINTIDIEKVTKFAGYRLSINPLGQSIPVTPGLPSQESHLVGGWF